MMSGCDGEKAIVCYKLGKIYPLETVPNCHHGLMYRCFNKAAPRLQRVRGTLLRPSVQKQHHFSAIATKSWQPFK